MREAGYYWVHQRGQEKPEPAYFDGEKVWYFMGTDMEYADKDMLGIYEKIERKS